MFNYRGGFLFKSWNYLTHMFDVYTPLIQLPVTLRERYERVMYFYGDFCHLLVTIKFSFMRKFSQNPCVMLLTHRNMPQLLHKFIIFNINTTNVCSVSVFCLAWRNLYVLTNVWSFLTVSFLFDIKFHKKKEKQTFFMNLMLPSS